MRSWVGGGGTLGRNNTWMHLLSSPCTPPQGYGALPIPILLRESPHCTSQDIPDVPRGSPGPEGCPVFSPGSQCPVILWALLPELWFQALELTLQIQLLSLLRTVMLMHCLYKFITSLKPWCPKPHSAVTNPGPCISVWPEVWGLCTN